MAQAVVLKSHEEKGKYMVVEFPEEVDKNGNLALGIISSTWTFKDENNKMCCYWPNYFKNNSELEQATISHAKISKMKSVKCVIKVKYCTEHFEKAQKKARFLEEHSSLEESNLEDNEPNSIHISPRKSFMSKKYEDFILGSDDNDDESPPKPPSLKRFTTQTLKSISNQTNSNTQKLVCNENNNNSVGVQNKSQLRVHYQPCSQPLTQHQPMSQPFYECEPYSQPLTDLNSNKLQHLSQPPSKLQHWSQPIGNLQSQFQSLTETHPQIRNECPSSSQHQNGTSVSHLNDKSNKVKSNSSSSMSSSSSVNRAEKNLTTKSTTASGGCHCEGMMELLLKKIEKINSKLRHLIALSQEGKDDKDIAEEFSLDPVNNLVELDELNQRLEDKDVFLRCCKSLQTLGGKDVFDATRRILATLLSHELALTLNWTGRQNKSSFKCFTNVTSLILASLRKTRVGSNATLQEVEAIIKVWLRNASDREGGRHKRSRHRSV